MAKYITVVEFSSDTIEFDRKVQEFIEMGFVCQGGVSVSHTSYTDYGTSNDGEQAVSTIIMQAMVK